jgi:hypothetical protein
LRIDGVRVGTVRAQSFGPELCGALSLGASTHFGGCVFVSAGFVTAVGQQLDGARTSRGFLFESGLGPYLELGDRTRFRAGFATQVRIVRSSPYVSGVGSVDATSVVSAITHVGVVRTFR